MKIKNISEKVISIMTKVLLPDEECETSADVVALPSVNILIENGLLKVVDSDTKKADVKEAAESEAEANSTNEEQSVNEEVKPADKAKTADAKKADTKKANAKK